MRVLENVSLPLQNTQHTLQGLIIPENVKQQQQPSVTHQQTAVTFLANALRFAQGLRPHLVGNNFSIIINISSLLLSFFLSLFFLPLFLCFPFLVLKSISIISVFFLGLPFRRNLVFLPMLTTRIVKLRLLFNLLLQHSIRYTESSNT